ncbi:MAG TPA: prepilin-type N-terminal cleavage/methylation domain-containing protein [Planctomycetota bacterium]|nr:prepilin-type N-terminal cleavage/methylation domain-containing protein [Planctomycetota bacterium]
MTSSRLTSDRRGGFTLIEVLIALALIGLVFGNIFMVMDSSAKAFRAGVSTTDVEFQADRTLDRIALALMASCRDSLAPSAESPLHSSSLTYETVLGLQDGAVVVGDPQRIEFTLLEGQVVWTENPALPGERSVVWTNWVRDYLTGELPNGIDDNGNGLVDEKGLAFTIQGDRVEIRLALEREGPDKKPITIVRETVVTCRN